MKHKVFVDGQEGTTGLRIHEYLAARDDIEVLQISSEHRKDTAARAELLNAADIAFLCLPDAAARESALLVTDPDTCVIDASTAHRTAAGWAFGLPELAPGQRDALRRSKRIANPGCHATAFILLLRPLVDAGLIDANAAISATSITGFSGGGKKMIEQYEAAAASCEAGSNGLRAPRPYALGLDHKHLPEMRVHTGLASAPVFMPVVGPFYKGLAVSVPLHRSQWRSGCDGAALRQALTERYAEERFVRVLPEGDPELLTQGFFDVQACNDTNRVELCVFASADQAILIARLDNLGKGASGAAVQAMNLHLGLDEGLGLEG